ncbi:hypothetical protein [Mycolicibacterium sp. 050158]|jgi:hypothetical protein|uniref:hypothetical protein n=1 Tax=Mycolicibacterium sp. 050158 TaxID=3090602 RepID=UPI00299E98A5|nr:hypothetical protein [Mycolicibacterium sp. 050158]MDX1889554.1 hypothetical protein [Mycolicibacterium sp. 050158]
MTSPCRECREGLDHCHGTVVHHVRHRVECTEDCAMPDGLHSFSIDCEAVGCACAETLEVTRVS